MYKWRPLNHVKTLHSSSSTKFCSVEGNKVQLESSFSLIIRIWMLLLLHKCLSVWFWSKGHTEGMGIRCWGSGGGIFVEDDRWVDHMERRLKGRKSGRRWRNIGTRWGINQTLCECVRFCPSRALCVCAWMFRNLGTHLTRYDKNTKPKFTYVLKWIEKSHV